MEFYVSLRCPLHIHIPIQQLRWRRFSGYGIADAGQGFYDGLTMPKANETGMVGQYVITSTQPYGVDYGLQGTAVITDYYEGYNNARASSSSGQIVNIGNNTGLGSELANITNWGEPLVGGGYYEGNLFAGDLLNVW